MTTVMAVTLTMLFLPKLFGLLLAWGRPALTRAYGGYTRLGIGVDVRPPIPSRGGMACRVRQLTLV